MKVPAGIIIAALLAGCEKKESVTPESPPPQLSNEVKGSWPPASFAKVTGYRFKTAEVEEFSCITDDGTRINLGELAKRTEASAEASREQVADLLGATFHKEKGLSAAACHEPHHLFLFQDGSGQVTHAIEICFGCTSIRTLPPMSEEQWQHHDFRRLYKLCDSLGLTDLPSDEYFKIWDEREAP